VIPVLAGSAIALAAVLFVVYPLISIAPRKGVDGENASGDH
jgi:hypothetical protein